MALLTTIGNVEQQMDLLSGQTARCELCSQFAAYLRLVSKAYDFLFVGTLLALVLRSN